MTAYDCVFVDVFTTRPLEGNQLAVFGDGPSVPEALLQALAHEIGFSETVYVYPPSSDAADARIRIFTPAAELPFAGHPVLGTAAWLAATRSLDAVRLETGVGVIAVSIDGWFARMVQPVPTWEPFPAEGVRSLLDALGVPDAVLPVDVYDNGLRHVYVTLPTRDDVAALVPEFAALQRAAGEAGVNCFAGDGLEWKTRMFGPGLGVDEDPGTGSAAGPLAVHLARHGRISWGDEIVISQGAELRRPCTLYATARGSDAGVDAVEVGGHAVVVGRAEFALDA